MCIRDRPEHGLHGHCLFGQHADKAAPLAQSSGLGAVSYTHLDVYKRQGQRGGSTVLTEVPEIFGAEGFLMDRCINKEVFVKAEHMINGCLLYTSRCV